jgi:hypothetical protein
MFGNAAMGLPINPLDILKLFLDRGIRNKAEIATYLDEIATTASFLADIWAKWYQSIREHDLWDDPEHDYMFFAQMRHAHEAVALYERASTVTGARIAPETQKELIDGLGRLIAVRNQVRQTLDELIDYCNGRPKDQQRINDVNPELMKCKHLIALLQEEAGTLKGLAVAVRASAR